MMAFSTLRRNGAGAMRWGRPGLNLKTRSLLNLAMLTALNRAAEIKLHVRGAINNGVTVDDKEVLLHATVYCGIPAGLDAFKAANEVLKEMGKLAYHRSGRSTVRHIDARVRGGTDFERRDATRCATGRNSGRASLAFTMWK